MDENLTGKLVFLTRYGAERIKVSLEEYLRALTTFRGYDPGTGEEWHYGHDTANLPFHLCFNTGAIGLFFEADEGARTEPVLNLVIRYAGGTERIAVTEASIPTLLGDGTRRLPNRRYLSGIGADGQAFYLVLSAFEGRESNIFSLRVEKPRRGGAFLTNV